MGPIAVGVKIHFVRCHRRRTRPPLWFYIAMAALIVGVAAGAGLTQLVQLAARKGWCKGKGKGDSLEERR